MIANNWQEHNAQHLAASLEWLRLRLVRLIGSAAKSQVENSSAQVAETEANSFFQRVLGRTHPHPVQPPRALLSAATDENIDAEINRAAEKIAELESSQETQPALVVLSRQLGLPKFERDILLLCTAMELDPNLSGLCAQAQGHTRAFPTFALAFTLFDDPAWEALSPDRPLRFWRLLEINQPGAQALTTSALRADERIVNYLKGLNTLDDRLVPFLSPQECKRANEAELSASQHEVAATIVNQWQHAAPHAPLDVMQLLGVDPASKQAVAAHTATALGRHLYRLPAEAMPLATGDLETLARLWQRESLLLPLALYVDAQEADSVEILAALQRFLLRADGVIFLAVRENWTRLQRANLTVEINKPTRLEQQTIWQTQLATHPLAAPQIAEQLTGQFNLNQPAIQKIADQVFADQPAPETVAEALWDGCRAVTRPRLDGLAQKLDAKATWEDLVLPPEPAYLLQQLTAQVSQRHTVYETWGLAQKMNRGMGLNALFAGDSGTGKTMAAEVIANALRLDLYRIDLSSVVSKYIGESEKNLRRVFDAAENGGVILLFDEADALFGKRSEVKDSHDRYANIEINYLLQRMEAFTGLAILATNMKSALDSAFLRRLRFVVNFPYPSAAERKEMWQKAFPAAMPVAALDYDRLARLNLTGGNIHSIALNAAFMAAPSDSKVTMPIVLAAARMELRKLERPINEAEFQWAVSA